MPKPYKKPLLAQSKLVDAPLVTIPQEGFIRLHQVLIMYPVSYSTLWKQIKKGLFPKPYSIGARAIAWDISEVKEALEKVKSEGRTQSNGTQAAREARALKIAQRKELASHETQKTNSPS